MTRGSHHWEAAGWLISKDQAHLEGDRLVPDSVEARKVLDALGSVLVYVTGDRFKAKPRRDIPENEKPTPAMRRAQIRNIRKARAARHKTTQGKRR